MKQKNQVPKWIAVASLALALTGSTGLGATDIVPTPGAMQPGGDTNDTTLNFGTWWTGNGTVTEDFDSTMSSSNNIAGSIHVVFDCPGGTVTPIASANLAFGNFLSSLWGDNNWLGAGNEFDAAQYQSMTMDINIATTVSSNTPIPLALFGYAYENVALTNLPITTPGWQHLVIPIPATINLSDWTAYGVYDWYNTVTTTPPAHVEYWFDNVRMVARLLPPPPPTMSMAPVTQSGLLFDSAPGEGGQRGAIDTVTGVPWAAVATPSAPVTYAMTVAWVPSPAIYSNYEAHIFLAPNSGVGNPDWNLSDMGYLQILDNSDGTATARMMWKTNDPFDNTMLFNTQPGGTYGTNGYAAGTLGYLTAPTMLGTWSITFTDDSDFIVGGPGGVSTNLSLPADWVTSFGNVNEGANYAYFGGGPNGAANAGQPMYLSQVLVAGTGTYAFTNNFSTLPLDTTTWGLLGNETAVVLPQPAWWVKWTSPAANFNLWATTSLNHGTPWILLSGNTNLPVPVATYAWGTNFKALVATADLPGTDQNFLALKKQVLTSLQVLMPGETNAPFTSTGKIGTPDPQSIGTPVDVTVNAVDSDWNIVASCVDTVHITSSDPAASLPADAALVNGTGTFTVIFGTSGSAQTVTASDVTTPSVSANTGSPTTVQ